MNDENEKINEFPTNFLDVRVVEMNSYVLPDSKINAQDKYILNGDNNSFFRYIRNRYEGSPTNAGIINKYVHWIIGDGLIDENGFNINKYISEEDVELICLDYVVFGQASTETIWSQGSKLLKEEPAPIRFRHINTDKLGLNIDVFGEVDGYWFSFDWEAAGTYKPKLFAKFDGVYKDNAKEMLTFRRVSPNPYFPQPHYVSGLQYAHSEEEISNSSLMHILNGFSAGKIINCRGGVPATPELAEEYKKKILSKLTGSENKNKVIVAFSNGLDEGEDITVTNLEVTQIDAQAQYFSSENKVMLFAAHGVDNPILFGAANPSGFSDSGEETVQALKSMYRSNINPMRKVIIRNLEYLFKFVEPNIKLQFKDFEELIVVDQNKPIE